MKSKRVRFVVGILFLAAAAACGGRTPLDVADAANVVKDATLLEDGGVAVDAGASEIDVADDASPNMVGTYDAGSSCVLVCPGCCQGTVCVPSQAMSAAACGYPGNTCSACGDSGTCVKGGCEYVGCSPPCDDGGVCVNGTCLFNRPGCPTPCGEGGVCIRGSCLYGQPACGPANCRGCCVSPNMCVNGTDVHACGVGGLDCETCGPGAGPCVPQADGGGLCGGVQTCTPDNCSSGCCVGNLCLVTGRSDSACGWMGQACVACAPGETCVGSQCQKPPFCVGGVNCGGCCLGNQCVKGNADNACAWAAASVGDRCLDCTAQGLFCHNGYCTPGCSPSNCAGCCSGNVCATGTQVVACGVGGVACNDCTVPPAFTGAVCEAGICGPP
jgi:hypothetical protein